MEELIIKLAKDSKLVCGTREKFIEYLFMHCILTEKELKHLDKTLYLSKNLINIKTENI